MKEPRRPKEIPTDPVRSSIEFELIAIKDFLEIIESGAISMWAEESKEVYREKSFSLMDEAGQKKFEKQLKHDQMFGFEVPIRIRYSYLTQLYVLFESGAAAVCSRLAEKRKYDLSLKDLSGGKSYRGFQIFLTKVCPVSGIRWDALDEMRVVRNCIVHSRGEAISDSSYKKLMAIEKKGSGLKILKSGFIYLPKKWCIDMTDTVRDFFHMIFDLGDFGPRMIQYKMGHAQEYQKILIEELKAEQVAAGNDR